MTSTSGLISCDTFVVLPPCTSKGVVIFGKNSDRPSGEVQEVVYYPAKKYQSGDKIECTYITIDATSDSHAVILSKPSWMWGCEMGANEFGVCIGNEAVWTKLQSKEDNEERLLGMDLVRLGLERGKSAREALEVITSLLEKHGQGGACSDAIEDFTYHNGFLIADGKEAWVLETASKEWVAEKVESGFRNISNCLSVGSKIDLMSKGVKEMAISKGFWNGDGEFNFADAYSSGGSALGNERFQGGKDLLSKLSEQKSFDVKSMMKVLRDEDSGVCRGCENAFPSVSSQVSSISSTLSRPNCHWFTGTPDPKHSVFKPFIFCPDIQLTQSIASQTFNPDPAKVKPRFQSKVDRRHPLYKRHETFYPKVTSSNEEGLRLRETLAELENNCVDEVEQLLDNYKQDDNKDLLDLFNDAVEAELRFYK